ncbi:hypothetical protein CHUAL_001300 [Chamberlinius hualienensis]
MTNLSLTVLLVLCGCWMMMAEARPMQSRSRRATIAEIISVDKLRNPCSVNSLDCTQEDNAAESTTLDANLAKDKIESLLTVSGPTFSCSGAALNPSISMPQINDQMTKVEKLQEIYKSLIHHAAFMQAIASHQRGPLLRSLNEANGSLQNVQCSMECTVRLSEGEKSSLVTSATSRDYPTGTNSSRDNMYICLTGNQLIKLLDLLITVNTSA